jgi:glycosyltransferase involved in cell wall biosynthesis
MALEMSAADRAAFGQRAMDRVCERYSWEAVTDAYEKLLRDLSLK